MTPIQKRAVGLVLVAAARAGPLPRHAQPAAGCAGSLRVADDPPFVLQAIAACDWWYLPGLERLRIGTVWMHEHWAIAEIAVDCGDESAASYRVCFHRQERRPWTVLQIRGAPPSMPAGSDAN